MIRKPAIVLFTFLIWACDTPRNETQRINLQPGSWNATTKSRIETLFKDTVTGRNIIFDFDNTIVSRDIGEAVFALISEKGDERLFSNAKALSMNAMELEIEPIDYYELLLDVMTQQENEKEPFANGYAWVVQMLKGYTVDEVLEVTSEAYSGGLAENDYKNNRDTLSYVNGYLRPFFYPEMVDLIGSLLASGHNVFVVSASNVWSVRWMVVNYLNPRLQEQFGVEGIPAENVVGISLLLRDNRDGHLYKDHQLVANNLKYREMELSELQNYELTSLLSFPVSTYHGKVASILKYFNLEKPYLAVGDSPNDFAMLHWADNALWIARLEKLDYQRKYLNISESNPSKWIVQPVLYKQSPGFIANEEELRLRAAGFNDLQSLLDITIKVTREPKP